MGRDGAEGAARMRAQGHPIFVQNPDDCVVELAYVECAAQLVLCMLAQFEDFDHAHFISKSLPGIDEESLNLGDDVSLDRQTNV